MENERSHTSGFSAIGITAAVSVFVLAVAIGLEIKQAVGEKNAAVSYVANETQQTSKTGGDASADTSDIARIFAPQTQLSPMGAAVMDELVTKYSSLQDQGLYTEEVGQKVAEKMAVSLKPTASYDPYTLSDIHVDTDTSHERMLKYRVDLQGSLAPLLKNTQAEFEIFAYYVDTKDVKYLTQLKEVSQNYRDAVSKTLRVSVPRDATNEHLAILNAMEQFAATLDAMIANAADPFASVALLRTYNQAEADMLSSFKSLAVYYKQKNS